MESNKQGYKTMWSGGTLWVEVRGSMTIYDLLLNVMVNKMTQRAGGNRIWEQIKNKY